MTQLYIFNILSILQFECFQGRHRYMESRLFEIHGGRRRDLNLYSYFRLTPGWEEWTSLRTNRIFVHWMISTSRAETRGLFHPLMNLKCLELYLPLVNAQCSAAEPRTKAQLSWLCCPGAWLLYYYPHSAEITQLNQSWMMDTSNAKVFPQV